ncbi:hypothetical protein SO802_022800 [Lithocarpus litseifolius]|uniref:VOC domain-containing protein n=1 Tax=Lithocarpus litseifolius TaxID=425828 RepID=A0AAW2C6A4_9ROSI
MAQQEVTNGGSEKKTGGGNDIMEVIEVKFTALKPQLAVEAPKANEAILFYKAAFGAEELGRTLHPKRKADQEHPLILSAQLSLAGSTILVSDLADPSETPAKTEGTGLVFYLETDDVASAINKAVGAGAVVVSEIAEGEGAGCGLSRVGKVKDPYGVVWAIGTPAAKAAVVEA